MKKIITIVILALVVFTFTGCNSEIKDLGERALTIIEKYNDGDISEEEAKERLDAIQDTLENKEATTHDDELRVRSINNAILDFKYATWGLGTLDTTTYDVEEELRNNL